MLRSRVDVFTRKRYNKTYALCVKIINLHLIVESFNQRDYISINKEHMKITICLKDSYYTYKTVLFNIHTFPSPKKNIFSYIHVKQVNCKISN